MTDNKEVEEKAHLEDTIKDMLKAGASKDAIPDLGEIADSAEMINKLGKHIEEGMLELYQNIMHLGETLDVARLHNFMITKILVEKGVVTEKEIEERFKTDVLDELRKQHDKVKEKLEKDLQEKIEEKE